MAGPELINHYNLEAKVYHGADGYHTDYSENPERPNSPNVLPMSQCYWGVGFFV